MKRLVSFLAAFCLLLSVCAGCSFGEGNSGNSTSAPNENITVIIKNGGEIVCAEKGAEIKIEYDVYGANDSSVIFIIDETDNCVSVNEITGVMTLAAGIPDGYVFRLTLVSKENKSKYAEKDFTVKISDIADVDPLPDLGDGKPVYLPNGRIKAPENNLIDDFTNGVSYDKWYISTQTWGGLPNYNGCRSENVSYTDDGILLLKAQGAYSTDVPLSGAAIITRDTYGAGSYTAAMKVMPRLGACNAMWTYYYGRGGNDNHEIDIELPGHVTPGGGEIGYDRVLNTNWLAETSSVSTGTVTASPANDGKWHTYRFDWHTAPQPRIDYYVDGVLTHTEYELIPSIKGLLWLGCWLPRNWCGQPDFEVDYMMIDWVSYVPFGQPTTEPSPTPRPGGFEDNRSKYPQRPVSMPVTDYISNGTFEGNVSAWQTSGARIVNNNAYSGGSCLYVNNTASASQTVTAVYGGFKYNLSAMAKTNGAARIEVNFYNRGGAVIPSGTRAFRINSAGYESLGGEITAPAGSDYMVVSVLSESGASYVDNLSVRLK